MTGGPQHRVDTQLRRGFGVSPPTRHLGPHPGKMLDGWCSRYSLTCTVHE